MAASPQIIEDVTLEAFELRRVTLRLDDGATIAAPVIDGWIQLDQPVLAPPDPARETAFFAALGRLVAALRSGDPAMPWFLMHKAPGLRLRFRIGDDAAGAALAWQAVGAWSGGWLGAPVFAGFFDQAELRPLSHRARCDALLTAAADALLVAGGDAARATTGGWAEALARIVAAQLEDRWLGYEALARLRRLRGAHPGEDGPASPLLDPAPLAAAWPRIDAGFAASVAYLQSVNLILNMWGIPGATQVQILDQACALLAPDIVAR